MKEETTPEAWEVALDNPMSDIRREMHSAIVGRYNPNVEVRHLVESFVPDLKSFIRALLHQRETELLKTARELIRKSFKDGDISVGEYATALKLNRELMTARNITLTE